MNTNVKRILFTVLFLAVLDGVVVVMPHGLCANTTATTANSDCRQQQERPGPRPRTAPPKGAIVVQRRFAKRFNQSTFRFAKEGHGFRAGC